VQIFALFPAVAGAGLLGDYPVLGTMLLTHPAHFIYSGCAPRWRVVTTDEDAHDWPRWPRE
jgi:hypothetical protein